jgi:hypothetical protein
MFPTAKVQRILAGTVRSQTGNVAWVSLASLPFAIKLRSLAFRVFVE